MAPDDRALTVARSFHLHGYMPGRCSTIQPCNNCDQLRNLILSQRAEAIAAAKLGIEVLVEALDNLICPRCENRIGWNGEMCETDRRSDWRKCPACRPARAALLSAGEKT